MLDRYKKPSTKPLGDFSLEYPEPITLHNGIKLWVVGNGEDNINRLAVYMGGGMLQESVPMEAALTGILCMEGNANMDSRSIAEALDYYGSWKSAQAYDSVTQISLSSLNRNFAHTARILLDCIASPTFPAEECRLFQRRLASNIDTARQRVQYLADERMKQLYYGESHPLARKMTSAGVMGIGLASLHKHHDTYYNRNNCRLVLAGKITDREIQTLDDTFGHWSSTGATVSEVPLQPEPSPAMLDIVDKPGAKQSAVSITLRAIPRQHPDYFKLRLTTTALGGYFGSRLNKVIREEKGYTYGIQACLAGRADDAYISISTQCNARYTWPLIAEVKKAMQQLKAAPLPQTELDAVKQYMYSDLVKTLDTPFNTAGYVGSCFLFGIYPQYFNDQVKAIDAMTGDDVMETAHKYFDIDKMRIVIAGDNNSIKNN